MALYLVVIPKDQVPIREKFTTVFKEDDFKELWDLVFLLDSKISSSEISEKIGIQPDGIGLVAKISPEHISGRASNVILQWLDARSET